MAKKKPKNQSHQRENAPKIVVISFGLPRWRWRTEQSAEQTKAKKIGIFRCVHVRVCVWVCVVWIWRKVHDHEANYLAKLGESLALCVPMKWHCLNCAIAPQFLLLLSSSSIALVLGSELGLMSRINQRCHCLNLKSTFKQSTDTTEQRFRSQPVLERAVPRLSPSRQPQHESLMISANDWVTCCKSVAIVPPLFPLSSSLSFGMSAPARGFNCPQLITNWPKRIPD